MSDHRSDVHAYRTNCPPGTEGVPDKLSPPVRLSSDVYLRNAFYGLLGGFQGVADSEGDCQVRAAAPEGAMLLPEEFRLRRGRDRRLWGP